MPHRWFLVLAAVGIGVASYFLLRSIDDDLVYYLYTSEAVSQRAEFPDGRRFRLAGIVVPGTLEQADPGNSRFRVTDGAATVAVELTRTPPPLFREDVPVVLDGSWRGEVFVADDALIRHDENYQAPSTGNYPGTPG